MLVRHSPCSTELPLDHVGSLKFIFTQYFLHFSLEHISRVNREGLRTAEMVVVEVILDRQVLPLGIGDVFGLIADVVDKHLQVLLFCFIKARVFRDLLLKIVQRNHVNRGIHTVENWLVLLDRLFNIDYLVCGAEEAQFILFELMRHQF